MAPRKSEPATKHDLRLLEERLTKRFDHKISESIAGSEARLTKHFDHQISQAITDSEDRILRHFDLTVETIRHDLLGANADRIELLHDRITRVEQHVGLAPA
jgi:hypothetical protein